jgi:uncharacterized protein YndB with AHSA1/START domain
MSRLYEAPRERVFAAWTRAEHFARWRTVSRLGRHLKPDS